MKNFWPALIVLFAACSGSDSQQQKGLPPIAATPSTGDSQPKTDTIGADKSAHDPQRAFVHTLLKYAPSVSTITGILEENTGFATVRDGDPKSDGRISYFVIWPDPKFDLAGGTDDGDTLHKAMSQVDRVQLVAGKALLKAHENKKVKITGTLSPADKSHPFTPLLMNVSAIEDVQ